MFGLSLHHSVILIYAIYLVVMSFITFILYHADKRKAKKGKWRIKEATLLLFSLFLELKYGHFSLLLFSFFGGAFGGYTAMLLFRHKTTREHWYFTFVNIFGIILHASLMVLLIFFIKF